METTANTAITALAEFGPGWIIVFAIIAFIVFLLVKLVPTLQSYVDGKLELSKEEAQSRADLEQAREKRKAEEELSREQRDRERSEMEGRWASQYDRAIAAQERSNILMDSLKSQLEATNMLMQDNLSTSKMFQEKLAEMSLKIDDVHRHVVK